MTSNCFKAELVLNKPGLVCTTALSLWLLLKRNLLLQSLTCSPAGFAMLEAFPQTNQNQQEKEQRQWQWWMIAGTTDQPRQKYTPKDTPRPNPFYMKHSTEDSLKVREVCLKCSKYPWMQQSKGLASEGHPYSGERKRYRFSYFSISNAAQCKAS